MNLRSSRRVLAVSLCFVTLMSAQAQVLKPYEGMDWRLVGPFRGGRSIACAGSQARPQEYFFGATGGGVWKSTNGGTDWDCVSDGFFNTASVGALAVAANNPDVVYAGTGERDIRGNISHGDGVYRSSDAGKTWTHIGLKACQTISRIVVHPTNPDIVYVAALGHVYVDRDIATGKIKADSNRGVYKSTDGGKNWKRILFKNDVSGAVDLCLDPSNPETLYAATWEAWRTPYTMHSGGPGSGIFKTTNGGAKWDEITRAPGLPKGMVGKIGLSVSPVNPLRVWAHVEALDGGIFRSDDGGKTFAMTNDSRNWRQRAWYYTHIIADPKNADAAYVLNVGAGRTTDGGKTFSGMRTPHSDNHDLWIAPDDPKRMIVSNDGGGAVSTDGGQTWTEQDFPTSQFYHVSTDNAFPYRILGAQQDNSTVRIPSRTFGPGITRTDWTSTAGGESGYVVAKPDDPDIVFGGSYGGDLSRINHRTNISRAVDPWPDNPMGHGAVDLVERFQWTFPIVFSPHNPNVLYTCSQHVMRSTDLGNNWFNISPDLTRNDKRTLGSSGGPITKDNTSVEYYGTVFTLAESPIRKDLLWAGSDDGLVHLSQDGGKTWSNVTPKGMPTWGLCSMIEASPSNEGKAYLALDNHENDDLKPYVYVTTDFGQSWQLLVNGIDPESPVRVVREDPKQSSLLFAGTETGLFVSMDGGNNWERFKGKLPVTPIHDLTIKSDDLVVATHGRSFWVLDDISPLRQIVAKTTEPFLFAPRDTMKVTWGGSGSGSVGKNPPSGFLINYFLPADTAGVEFELADPMGTVISTAKADGKAGFNRITITAPRYPGSRTLSGLIFWGGFSGSLPAPPGTYKVTMKVATWSATREAKLTKDPRTDGTDEEQMEQYKFARKIADRLTETHEAHAKIRDVKKKIATILEKDKGLTRASESLVAKLSAIEEEIYQVKNQSGQDPLNYPIRLNNRLAALLPVVLGGEGPPSRGSQAVFANLSAELDDILKRLGEVWAKDLVAFNAELAKKTLEAIVPEAAGLSAGGGGRRGGS